MFTINPHELGSFPQIDPGHEPITASRLELTNLASASCWLNYVIFYFTTNPNPTLFLCLNDSNPADKLVKFKSLLKIYNL